MITCMSSMTHGKWRGAAALVVVGLISASCSAGGETRGSEAAEPDIVPAAATSIQASGVPAQPGPEAGPPSDRSQVISMESMAEKFPDRGQEPGCFITFAYRGNSPETLIWDGEDCSALTARFGNRAFLEASGDWSQLDASQQADVDEAPGGEVLYVEGQFAASIYPLGPNQLTYEVAVSD